MLVYHTSTAHFGFFSLRRLNYFLKSAVTGGKWLIVFSMLYRDKKKKLESPERRVLGSYEDGNLTVRFL